MMDELMKQFAAQFLVAAVITVMLFIVYKDLVRRMEKADEERAMLIAALIDNTRRTKLIEQETIGDISPTLPKRPS